MSVWNKKSGKSGGFTLIEAVIFIVLAGALVPIILMGVDMALRRSSEALATCRNAAVADSILRKNIEAMIGLEYTDSGLDVVTDQSLTIKEAGFSGTYTVAYIDENIEESAGDVGYKKITVNVTSPEGTDYAINAIVTSWH